MRKLLEVGVDRKKGQAWLLFGLTSCLMLLVLLNVLIDFRSRI
jgi:hypothetical protein